MQVVVTSYQRPRYLKPTVDALRKQERVEIIVVDGGSDDATRTWIAANSDRSRFFRNNPGADFLKNTGMEMITDPVGMVMSDDLIMPTGGAEWAFEQYSKLNIHGRAGDPEWGWVACNMDYIERKPPRLWKSVNGVDIMKVDTCQVSGVMMDRELWKRLGGWPRYGRAGSGDWAFSARMRKAGYKLGYLRRPCLVHLGSGKYKDFADYSEEFDAEQRQWHQLARADLLSGHAEELMTDVPEEILP